MVLSGSSDPVARAAKTTGSPALRCRPARRREVESGRNDAGNYAGPMDMKRSLAFVAIAAAALRGTARAGCRTLGDRPVHARRVVLRKLGIAQRFLAKLEQFQPLRDQLRPVDKARAVCGAMHGGGMGHRTVERGCAYQHLAMKPDHLPGQVKRTAGWTLIWDARGALTTSSALRSSRGPAYTISSPDRSPW